MISQSATSKAGRGGRRKLPRVFTEQGVAMLSGVLRSPRAIQVNVALMRTFIRLRQMPASNEKLAQKLARLEEKYDGHFRVVPWAPPCPKILRVPDLAELAHGPGPC